MSLDPNGGTGTSGGRASVSSGGSHNANNNRDRQGSGDHTATEGRRPILLDLDGDGIEITERSKSTVFTDTSGDGLEHRTAWAGDGEILQFSGLPIERMGGSADPLTQLCVSFSPSLMPMNKNVSFTRKAKRSHIPLRRLLS